MALSLQSLDLQAQARAELLRTQTVAHVTRGNVAVTLRSNVAVTPRSGYATFPCVGSHPPPPKKKKLIAILVAV